MKLERFVSLVDGYIAFLEDRGIVAARMINDRLLLRSPANTMPHALHLLRIMREKSGKWSDDAERAHLMHMLGFVQAILWMCDELTILEISEHTHAG